MNIGYARVSTKSKALRFDAKIEVKNSKNILPIQNTSRPAVDIGTTPML